MKKYKFEEIAFNITDKKKPVEEDKDTYLGLEHLDPGTLKVTRFGSEVAPIGEKLIMKKGDVLFGKRRAYQKKVAIAPFDGIFSAHGMVLRPNTSVIDEDFFPLFISSDYFLDIAIKISVGSLSPTINWRDLRRTEFELPSLEKQKELARILWSIVDTIESYKTLITDSEKYVKIKFMDELKKWKEIDGVKEIALGDLSTITTGKLNANAAVENGRYPFFTCAKEILSIDSYSYECECVLVAGNGDFNTKYYNGKFDAYQRTYIVESKDKTILTVPYIYRFLTQYIDILKEQAIGGVIKYIKLENLTLAPITVPSIDEQNRFIELADAIDKSNNKLKNSLEELELLYKKIVIEAFLNKED